MFNRLLAYPTTLVIVANLICAAPLALAQTSSEAPSRKQLEVGSLVGPLTPTANLLGKLQLTSAFEKDLRGQATEVEKAPANTHSTFCWVAPNLYHQPLYFEQPYLERFGVGPHRALQPWSTGMAFYGRIPLLPISLLKHPPTSRDYTLGYRRPGDCVTDVPLVTGYNSPMR